MRAVVVATVVASSILWTASAEAQSRRGRTIDRSGPFAAEPAPPRGGFDRYAEPRGGGGITWNTPYPNGNFSNPGGGGGGASGP